MQSFRSCVPRGTVCDCTVSRSLTQGQPAPPSVNRMRATGKGEKERVVPIGRTALGLLKTT